MNAEYYKSFPYIEVQITLNTVRLKIVITPSTYSTDKTNKIVNAI